MSGNSKNKLNKPLSEFAKENHAVKLHSELFEEDYWLSPGEHIQVKQDGMAVYYVSEIELLQSLRNDKELLKQIHLVKKMFNGTIKEVKGVGCDAKKTKTRGGLQGNE